VKLARSSFDLPMRRADDDEARHGGALIAAAV
jgi:hypothetical protein